MNSNIAATLAHWVKGMNFNTNEEVYIYLEKLSLTDKYHTEVSDIWQRYRDNKFNVKDVESIRLAQLEMDIFIFYNSSRIGFISLYGSIYGFSIISELPVF